MGKHFWSRHMNDEIHEKQPGCVWGLLGHALDYHHWHSNVRKKKMIQHRKYEDDKPLQCDWSSKSEIFPSEVETLLEENDNPYLHTKRPHKANKHSIKTRIKALIAEAKDSDNIKRKESFPSKFSSLQRTYSIHHLESLDWKHPVILFPRDVEKQQHEANSENSDEAKTESKGDTDILEIFKVDKELFMKHLRETDEKLDPGTLGMNMNPKLSKSTSFPLLQRKKYKSSKLENKHKEVWSFRKEEKLEQAVDEREQSSEEHHLQKRTHRRSFSLNESVVEKYAQLFVDSYGADAKLRPSKSLKLANERGHSLMYFKRIRSTSNVDSYYSDLNFWVVDNDFPGNGSSVTATDTISGLHFIPLIKDKEHVPQEFKAKKDSIDNVQTMESNTTLRSTKCADDNCEAESPVKEFQDYEGVEHKCSNFAEVEPCNVEKTGEIFASFTHDAYPEKKISDLHYVMHLLDKSDIAASEKIWHTSDPPLSPQLFEEVEAYWPHQEDELTGWPDFYGCWHHMMLFHLVNETLLEVYDMSFPYYPKPLSNSCRIRPYPAGDHIIEEVSAKAGKVLDLKPEEKESLDCITTHNLANDNSWMNLQFESECVALDLEELIFDELLEELTCS